MSTFELFTPEYDILIAARNVANQQDMPAEVYRDTLLALTEHYQRLVRESHRLISRSDRAEKELNRLNGQLHKLAIQLEYKASHDPLTNVYNRGAIIERINQTLERNQAALIVLDIDHFKRVNDAYGHPTGDAVICALMSRVREVLKGEGSIGRVGGEEFTILLDNFTLELAVEIAGRIHFSLNDMPLPVLPQQAVTASFGVSWAPSDTCFDTLYGSADAALYKAKQRGRNCVEYQ
ncbi:diguanylate cyclase [Brenneria goodwinii]|uniref:diguanylate cyclase n=1 Tax=Brenneria goodwinii TaxID=1109412 RepID=A0A0G4JPV2_9GAMM|nr:GGDEF domain-containing protein [Brenneria goodwinii]ATA24992.1 diguanylate cyclase [Brenneria goodwinii]MCG8155538.1 GGDEF domain-containing protein [Brenneria goodwinii]MCG8160435.1 GGDEF domain-containing protein [Brenneria goodwinii]MCG8164958.1 GGDEF domain-containing protein [Brenneria goodwinii]MCG8169385.1 GGDEF domain-containing protein [Brenneria goodwinii]